MQLQEYGPWTICYCNNENSSLNLGLRILAQGHVERGFYKINGNDLRVYYVEHINNGISLTGIRPYKYFSIDLCFDIKAVKYELR